jgi:predicted GTPase
VTVYAGVDYALIRRRASRAGDVIIWDGGNNDFPFFRPDLEITVADPLRAGDETGYYPGEVNLRRAAVVVINKVNAATPGQVDALEKSIAALNVKARIVRTASVVRPADPGAIRGRRVLVVEDGPTLTHGNMPGGAGLAAAREFEAGEIIDPRPFAVGSIAEVYRRYPHIGPVLPAVGYRASQLGDLQATIEAVPCELVLSATPIDLAAVIPLTRKVVGVSYDIAELSGAPLREIVLSFLDTIRR